MFEQRKKTLSNNKVTMTSGDTKSVLPNAFVKAGLKESARTKSGNGSEKFSTTGDPFVDQFGVLGSYKKPRTFAEIEKDCELLWATDKRKSVLFTFYIRLITRQVSFFNGTKTEKSQKGAQLKHEGIMRMIWLHQKEPKIFWSNIGLFVSAGSWQDIIKMLQYDLVYHGWENRVLNWDNFGKLILSGLNNENTCELLKKYLPQIKANSACKTVEAQADSVIGKWISSLVFGTKGENTGKTYKQYRKMKTSGTAHEFQKLISQRKFNLLDFNAIHGRALHLMVKSKFLKNQGLEAKYAEWIGNPETKDVKFTGFVPELFMNIGKSLSAVDKNRAATLNKQFLTMVKNGGEKQLTNLIVVRDTSGSMSSNAIGLNMTSNDVAKSIALFFSYYQTGYFADSFIEFSNTAKMHKWVGDSPIERYFNDKTSFNGGTNFQSVIDLFCQIKAQGVEESEFPGGIVAISDGQFNPAELGKTNVEVALNKLRRAGFTEEYVSNFVIALWDIPNTFYSKRPAPKFETYSNVPNVFYMSGYNATIISFLTNKIKYASELVDEALSQELFNLIKV